MNTRSLILTGILSLCIIRISLLHAAENIVDNGDFDGGAMTSWTLYLYDPPNMSATAEVIDNECLISNISVADEPETWHIQLYQTFTEMQKGKLEAGQTYELSFDARTLSGSKSIYVFLGQNEGTWMDYIHETITINNEMQNYTFQFTADEEFSLVRLLFGIGIDETGVVLDNIRLEQKFLKVMSFNILEGGIRGLDTIFQIIKDNDADIILIQESSTADDNFKNKATQEGYYYVQNDLQKDWWTVFQPAVLSKYPIVSSEIYYRMVCTGIQVAPGVIIKAHSCHLGGNGSPEHYYHMKQIVREYLRYDKEQFPVIFGGDLNEWPEWTDVTGQLTDAGFNRDVYDRLDYIYSWQLTAVEGSERVVGDINDEDWPSDHNAVYVEYYMPSAFDRETETFTLNNIYQGVFNISAGDFAGHFPMGGLTSVKFLKTGDKGTLKLNSTAVSDHQAVNVADLDTLAYHNTVIGIDEIEWLGISGGDTAKTSSFLYIENPGVIDSFDRKKCLYDVDFLDDGTPLYSGNNDVFLSTSVSELAGAEFVRFPTYIAYFPHDDRWDHYFLLRLKTSATLYLPFDDRNMTPPWWIEGYFTELTGETFSSDEHAYTLYSKHVNAGDFTFGSIYMNWEQREYVDNIFFIVVPDETSAIPEDITGDLSAGRAVVYPNPSCGFFTLDIGEEMDGYFLTITDIRGQKVDFVKYNNGKVLQIEILSSPGIYFLTITARYRNQVVRVIKL